MPIAIQPYDPCWPARFEAERAALLAAVGGALADLAHVGSTAVPGLAARPVVDLLAGVPALADAARCLAPLAALGYQAEAPTPERHGFHKPGVQLAMVVLGGPAWDRALLARDFLRRHPKQALHFQQLKQILAARCGEDLAAYAAGKAAFVSVIEELARAERDGG